MDDLPLSGTKTPTDSHMDWVFIQWLMVQWGEKAPHGYSKDVAPVSFQVCQVAAACPQGSKLAVSDTSSTLAKHPPLQPCHGQAG